MEQQKLYRTVFIHIYIISFSVFDYAYCKEKSLNSSLKVLNDIIQAPESWTLVSKYKITSQIRQLQTFSKFSDLKANLTF